MPCILIQSPNSSFLAKNKITTTTNYNNSILQINKNIKNKNKKTTRIKNKEQKSEEEPMQIAESRSPLLLNLDKSISRAQDLLNKKNGKRSDVA
jgi:hypothetical protein